MIVKQRKIPKAVCKNRDKLNRIGGRGFPDEDILKAANSRLGWFRSCGTDAVNCALSPKILHRKTKDRPGLVDPMAYSLASSQDVLEFLF